MGMHQDQKKARKALMMGRLRYAVYVMGRNAIKAMLAEKAAEARAERVNARDHRPLVVAYDEATDTTKTLSEYRRESWPEPKPLMKPVTFGPGGMVFFGKFKSYRLRKGVNLKTYAGLVKPVGFLGMLKGRLLGADGKEL